LEGSIMLELPPKNARARQSGECNCWPLYMHIVEYSCAAI
jgi:hypothetical protein